MIYRMKKLLEVKPQKNWPKSRPEWMLVKRLNVLLYFSSRRSETEATSLTDLYEHTVQLIPITWYFSSLFKVNPAVLVSCVTTVCNIISVLPPSPHNPQ